MLRAAAVTILAGLACGTATAHAASGSVTDPKGDYPDIVKLAYSNASTKVTMTVTYAGSRAQNESFYLRWGKGQSYQVFSSPSAGLQELRYYASAGAATKKVACKGLVVKRPTSKTTTVTVPRTCLGKAPAKLRFQAIATEGLSSKDETRTTKDVARG